MVFGKKSNKGTDYDISVGEKKLKSIIGGQIVRNHGFYRKMAINGIRNTPKVWHIINSQIRKELKEGTLYPDGIEKRIDELIVENSPNSRLITENDAIAIKVDTLKKNILSKRRVAVEIPYQKSGVNDAIVGGAFFGEWGAVLGSLNEGTISWRGTDLLFIDDGISVRSTGRVILYEDIKKVIFAEKGRLFTVVSVITNSGENFVYKTGHLTAEASKSIIEENIYKALPKFVPEPVESKEVANNSIDDADILLKYADLYEKGLLTKEEFEIKKQELFNKDLKSENHSLKAEFIENSQKEKEVHFCSNCGEEVDEGTNFCTNCGAKLV